VSPLCPREHAHARDGGVPAQVAPVSPAAVQFAFAEHLPPVAPRATEGRAHGSATAHLKQMQEQPTFPHCNNRAGVVLPRIRIVSLYHPLRRYNLLMGEDNLQSSPLIFFSSFLGVGGLPVIVY